MHQLDFNAEGGLIYTSLVATGGVVDLYPSEDLLEELGTAFIRESIG